MVFVFSFLTFLGLSPLSSGLFRSDELIGHISVDLRVLLNKCTIFDSFPILSGRKEIGGKICVKIKLREPLLAKQVEEINQKWIIID